MWIPNVRALISLTETRNCIQIGKVIFLSDLEPDKSRKSQFMHIIQKMRQEFCQK
jgi:hypothetical protein